MALFTRIVRMLHGNSIPLAAIGIIAALAGRPGSRSA